VRPDANDDDDSVVSSADSDDRNVAHGRSDRSRRIVGRSTERDDDDDHITVGRADRSRRIVERWTERDYDVPDANGRGQRRVTVIRRSGGGGLFESLFGN
jgi:hypothetical protein